MINAHTRQEQNVRIRLVIISIFCLSLLSCTWGTSFTQTGKRYPPYNGKVQVYYEPPVGLVYEEIGLVTTEAYPIHLKSQVIKSLQEKAASKGANAIIFTGFEKTSRDTDLPMDRRDADEVPYSGNTRSELSRPQVDYVQKIITVKARAIRIEPSQ
jgi:hypothetical protein